MSGCGSVDSYGFVDDDGFFRDGVGVRSRVDGDFWDGYDGNFSSNWDFSCDWSWGWWWRRFWGGFGFRSIRNF